MSKEGKKDTTPKSPKYVILRNAHSCRKELPINVIYNRFQNHDLDCELNSGGNTEGNDVEVQAKDAVWQGKNGLATTSGN